MLTAIKKQSYEMNTVAKDCSITSGISRQGRELPRLISFVEEGRQGGAPSPNPLRVIAAIKLRLYPHS